MNYWLVKSEPDAYSWQEQIHNHIEPWTGVRNHQAKKNLQSMRNGDLAFFYHSNVGKEIVGIVKIVKEAYPDPTDPEHKWVCVDVETVCPVPNPVTLKQIKTDPTLQDIGLIKQSRLSVMSITSEHWAILCRLGQVPTKYQQNKEN
ncbi:EVE domain-containing protein [Commensalibacter oyaizuii]|uniref:EVE domain-containing protein n=1 Tax=Commensalibacter oyaizuii TaxID=3043873 RepID=A0ABT6PZ30_9PROT|nr:EVE domain-containing protein [Commensalibacter sp. TBRC 16381]MDI2090106.1 EVE domain-containing protein [Commensalibacter sp. TBRC 16381]